MTWIRIIIYYNNDRCLTEETSFAILTIRSLEERLNFYASTTFNFLRNCKAFCEKKRLRENCNLTIVKNSVL